MTHSMLVCVSHSPIIMIRAKPPREEPEISRLYQQCVAEIERYDPDVVVVFGSDHYSGFHLDMMPSYCIGLQARAEHDVGGFGGKLDVPVQEALRLIESLQRAGFDPAASHGMTVDHAFSQPIHRLLGGLDARPVIPVFLNAIAPPLPTFARIRELGTTIGLAMAQRGLKTLYLGSGGLSHHPTRYYPLSGTAAPEVQAWQMHAELGGSMSREEWFSRLRDMHEEGAAMLVDGRRTRADIKLNPEFDAAFLDMAMNLDFERTRSWEAGNVIETAGIGAMELLAWVAAGEAYKAADGRMPHASLYAPTLEYGIGYGMLCAGGAGP